MRPESKVEPVRSVGDDGPHGATSFGDAVGRQLVDAIPDGVVVVDIEGVIVFVNGRAAAMFGYDCDQLVGRSVETLVPMELVDAHRGQRAAFTRAPHTRPMGTGLMLEGRRHDGSLLPVEISLSPFETEDGAYVIAAVRDTTERVRAEEELRKAHDAVAMLEERERIARDLHDTVIQHIFAVGMNLQATEAQATDPVIKDRVQWAVDHLDETIREVRSAIFGLQSARASSGLRARLTMAVGEVGEVLGFEPNLHLDGLIDAAVDSTVGEEMLAVAREALSNVARHAGATRCEVELIVSDGLLELNVRDNGRGIMPGSPRGNGLFNMEARALALGGSFRIEPAEPRGTAVRWNSPARVPDRTEHR